MWLGMIDPEGKPKPAYYSFKKAVDEFSGKHYNLKFPITSIVQEVNMENKVNVKVEKLKIPTYKIHKYEESMFFENRNVQGASGYIPYGFNDRLGWI